VGKYVDEYLEQKEAIQKNSDGASTELIESIVEAPHYKSSNRPKRKLTPAIVTRVKECLVENKKKRSRGQQKQQMKKCDIHQVLQSEGHDIGYTSICALINELEGTGQECFIKQAYEYGQVCEFDWGEVKVFIEGTLKKLQMAVFTTAKGNYRYAHLFVKQDTASFQYSHALFFDHIGGVYREVVYDNMKVAVKRFVGPNEKEATAGLLSLSLYYQFGFRFCNVRRGNEKGHVERSVEYVRRKAFCGRDEFASVDEANAHLLDVCERLNALPPTGQQQTAQDILECERPYLFPVGPMFECGELRDSKVDKYSTISVETCHYSVPDAYVGQMVTVRMYPERILCYAEGQRLCEHPRQHGFQLWSIQLDHYLRSLQRKPGALAGSVALQQSEERLQELYRCYYRQRPKDFIELLHYMKEEGKDVSEIEQRIRRLHEAGCMVVSTDKIKLACASGSQVAIPGDPDDIQHCAFAQLLRLSRLLPQPHEHAREVGA
jgi:hypothetical protein